MPHGTHIYAKSSDLAKEKMCSYPQLDHELPHCKCALRFFARCLCVNLPDQ